MEKLNYYFKYLFACIFILINSQIVFSQSIDESIRIKLLSSMNISSLAWNDGNLEEFMHNYWKSDSLRFITKKGVTFGWQNTLNNYKKSYPNKEIMGKLEFDIISLEYIDKESILMVGKWKLKRIKDNLEGHFSLIWKEKDGDWKIILDHSS
jgi:hypothetical protein